MSTNFPRSLSMRRADPGSKTAGQSSIRQAHLLQGNLLLSSSSLKTTGTDMASSSLHGHTLGTSLHSNLSLTSKKRLGGPQTRPLTSTLSSQSVLGQSEGLTNRSLTSSAFISAPSKPSLLVSNKDSLTQTRAATAVTYGTKNTSDLKRHVSQLTGSEIELASDAKQQKLLNRTTSYTSTSSVSSTGKVHISGTVGRQIISGSASQPPVSGSTRPPLTTLSVNVPAVHYDFDKAWTDSEDKSQRQALSVFRDISTDRLEKSRLADVTTLKMCFVNTVSGSLLASTDYSKTNNPMRIKLIQAAHTVIAYDPEFILKMALYTRQELNIRSTTNFLLALAANVPSCRVVLSKYFSKSIILPSDWIQVAEYYQTFYDKSLNFGSLPAALRKAMVQKFPDFDEYQLGKYNKDSSKKKAKRKAKEAKKESSTPALLKPTSVSSDEEEEEEMDEDDRLLNTHLLEQMESVDADNADVTEQQKFTLKQLIRKLHITKPVEYVMCLIGKKYPESLQEFYRSHLPGTWEEERAGKRMKLATPITWETQLSLKGNKADTWESLLNARKLPYMAMLRNLRNLIRAGVSDKHHVSVINRLKNERAVLNSRQFPFRFFSAYQALTDLADEFTKTIDNLIKSAEQSGAPAKKDIPKDKAGNVMWWKVKKNKQKDKSMKYDLEIIDRYRKALDEAVKVATKHNVSPISGNTLILCDIGAQMVSECLSAKGMGKPKTLREISVLLGLMCQRACESSDLLVFNETGYASVKLEHANTILANMTNVLDMDNLKDGKVQYELPYDKLMDSLRDRVQIDCLIVLTIAIGPDSNKGSALTSFLRKYRHQVNPDILFVGVSLASASRSLPSVDSDVETGHDNDIYITGYSDQLLRFIAERGNKHQLNHIEKIDESYSLPVVQSRGLHTVKSPTMPLPVPAATMPTWRTVRVFVSSTFRDMHSERDLLSRFVFPALRSRARKHFIHVHEIDLRWGISEAELKQHRSVSLCLSEIAQCQFFIGILGERYGWIPDPSSIPDVAEYDWIRKHLPRASITELEMTYAALHDPEKYRERAFFFLRDEAFMKDVPKSLKSCFKTKNPDVQEHLVDLKERIRKSGLEVYDGYACEWAGVVSEKPIVVGLQDFAMRVLNNLWTGIQKFYPDENAFLDEVSHVTNLHLAHVKAESQSFVGRVALVQSAMRSIRDMKSGALVLSGKAGVGKSALLARLVTEMNNDINSGRSVFVHMVGAAPLSNHISATISRLCQQLNRQFALGVDNIAKEYRELVVQFADLCSEAAKLSAGPLTVCIDGIDAMSTDHQPHNLEWLPNPIPQNIVFVLTAIDNGLVQAASKRLNIPEILITALEVSDKSAIVRQTLLKYRKVLDESPFNNQMKLLVAKREASNALYLSLACEELRMFGVFEKVTDKLKSLPQTVPLLLQAALERVDSETQLELHGLPSIALCFLACSRHGLSSGELHHMLCYYDYLNDKPSCSIESMLKLNLEPTSHLSQHHYSQTQQAIKIFIKPDHTGNGVLQLSHSQIHASVVQRYMRGVQSALKPRLHTIMAGYFYEQCDCDAEVTHWNGQDPHTFTELTYHLSEAGMFDALESLLCNLEFIQAKCMLGRTRELLEDFTQPDDNVKLGGQAGLLKMLSKQSVQEYKTFITSNLHTLAITPSLTLQQAWNEPDESAPCRDAEVLINAQRVELKGRRLMKWLNKPSGKRPCVMTMSQLPQMVTCVCISEDDQYFACGDENCVVRLYQLATGKEVMSFCGHTNSISDVCFAGRSRLVSSSFDGSTSLWDVQHGHRIAVWKALNNRCVKACSADDKGKLIAAASWDCIVRVWNASDGQVVSEFPSDTRPVNCVRFHPDGQLLLTGGWDCTLKIWHIMSKARKAILRGHTSSIRDAAFSPSGRHIASAALNGEVKIWDARNGSQVGSVQGHSLPITRLSYSATGDQLVTASLDQKIKVWSGELGLPVMDIGHADYGPALCCVFCQNGDRSLSAVGYHSGTVRVFNFITGFMLLENFVSSLPVRKVAFSPNGDNVYAASDDCITRVLDVKTNQKIYELIGHERAVIALAVGSQIVATGSEDCCCMLYPAHQKHRNTTTVSATFVLSGHSGPVTACAFHPDENKMATASRDASVFIWDLMLLDLENAPSPMQRLMSCHADWITDCKWASTGQYLVTSSNDFTLKVWDMNSGQERAHLVGHMSSINGIAYKSGCIVSASTDGSVKVWSHKGVLITTLAAHLERANGCDIHIKKDAMQDKPKTDDWADMMDLDEVEETTASKKKRRAPQQSLTAEGGFNIDELSVITCSDDGLMKTWKPLQAHELCCLNEHSDAVLSVACSKSGYVLSSSRDRSVRLWRPPTEISRSESHNAEVTCIIAPSKPNSGYIISASRDGTIKLWAGSSVQSSMETTSTSAPQCYCTVQAHERSVNSMCYLDMGARRFLTASDDGLIKMWKINNNDTGTVTVSEESFYHMDSGKNKRSPVTSLCVKHSAKSLTTILSANWNGDVALWRLDGQARLQRQAMRQWSMKSDVFTDPTLRTSRRLIAPEWISNLTINSAEKEATNITNYNAVSITTDGYLGVWRISPQQKGDEMMKPFRSTSVVQTDQTSSRYASMMEETSTQSMLPASTLISVGQTSVDEYLLSTSNGTVLLADMHESAESNIIMKMSVQMHTDQAVLASNRQTDDIITGSRDHTLKIWRNDLIQTGELACPCAVTAVCSTLNPDYNVVYGDLHGQVHFIKY